MKTTTLIILAIGFVVSAGQPSGSKTAGPLSPREELATFRIVNGFRAELVAAEPEVIDPICLTFDEDGRLFVIEMRGYPNGGVGTGTPVLPGRIKLLRDEDGDGYYEKSGVFADDLRFPTGMTPWRGGLLVANAPDLLYLKDTDGDGKADLRKVLYTGFGTKNIQQLLNGLQFHFDNRIHGCNGLNESVIKSVEKPELPPLQLRSRHIRFKPDAPGSLEPTSGGGQYGLAADDYGNWFTCTNAEHLRHIVLPDHYLRRNPYLAVSKVVNDIPDGIDEHTPAAKVFRISPFEPWRVERTGRRVANPMGKRFPSTELVPGGYITSATGLIAHGPGTIYVCDPANNLIHRDALDGDANKLITFTARRKDEKCEFLASTDNWFRPVFLHEGPDGAIYLCDFYREVIETPLSLPEDIQKQYNLQSRARGRIWRIVGEGKPGKMPPPMSKRTDMELAVELASPFGWRRLTAQRLLFERQPKDGRVISRLRISAGTALAGTGMALSGVEAIHALWTLEGLGQLDKRTLLRSLRRQESKLVGEDAGKGWLALHPEVIVQGLRLAERRLAEDPELIDRVFDLVNCTTQSVQFQLAFTLGELKDDPRVPKALATLARRRGDNPWMRSAILSSSLPYASTMFAELVGDNSVSVELLAGLAGLTAAQGKKEEIRDTLQKIVSPSPHPAIPPSPSRPLARQMALMDGLARRLSPRDSLLITDTSGQSALPKQLSAFWQKVAASAENDKGSLAERLTATRILGYGPASLSATTLKRLKTPQVPSELQLAAVQSLGKLTGPETADVLLDGWPSYSPALRREVQEAMFARTERLPVLLNAIEKGQIPAAELEMARREQLLRHRNSAIRQRAEKVLAVQTSADRKQVVDLHRPILDLAADAERGRAVFKKNCATCHRLENEGFEVGPDLLSALRNKSKETLLFDILDPSREVDPRYVNYVAESKAGQVFSGLVASESSASIVLRRAETAEDTLLRSEIETLQSTAKSLMPEGLEKQMSQQELADLIAYLQGLGGPK